MIRFAWEWAILDWFYQIGNNIFDYLFWAISQLGGSIIIVGIMGIIYWCVDKEKGEKIAFAILTSICLNGIIKGLFSSKRPYEYPNKEYLRKFDGNILSDSAGGSTSFPSGHSQNATAAYTSIALNYPKKVVKVICIIIIILVPLSRLYLGVHFPIDVIVGLILGGVSSFVIFYIINKYINKKFLIYTTILVVFFPFIFFVEENDFFRGYGLTLGFAIGTFIESHYINFTNNTNLIQKLIRVLIGGFIVGILFVGVKLLPGYLMNNNYFSLLIHFIIAFTAFGIVPFLFKSSRNPKGI